MKYCYEDLQNMANLFKINSDKWLAELDALQNAINNLNMDGAEAQYIDAARNYFQTVYTSNVIPSIKAIIEQHNAEFQKYISAFEAADLGGGTKVNQKEMKSLKKDINKQTNDVENIHNKAKKTRSKAKAVGVSFSSSYGIDGIDSYRKEIEKETEKIVEDIKNIDSQYKDNNTDRINALASMQGILTCRKRATFDIHDSTDFTRLNKFIEK